MAGLDVYAACYRSLEAAIPERFSTPKILWPLIEAGRLGTKSGGGFFEEPGPQTEALLAYRNKAYVALQKLLDELGPAPHLGKARALSARPYLRGHVRAGESAAGN